MNEEYIQEPVTDVTENTETQSVEEIEEGIELTDTTSNIEEKEEVKTYTEEDLERIVNERINDMLPTKIEREKKRLERKYQDRLSKYEETESILKQGFGAKDITDANQKMREFYKEQGIDIQEYQRLKYNDDDEKALGELEASKIIKLGFDEMQEEANRLADIGTDKMTVRERALFTKLANELTIQKNRNELVKLGASKDLLEDLNFRQFSSQFNKEVPIKDIYEMYNKINNKNSKNFEKIGSMKNTKNDNNVVKDFYSREEALRFTTKDFDKNPALFKAVERSMTKW